MKKYKSLRVEEYVHELIKKIAEEEGRNVTKMLEILASKYKKEEE